MDQIPIFVLLVAIVATLMIVIEVGHPVGRWYRKEEGLDKYPLESSANGSVFGLLAFILAFAFGVSAKKFSDLRDLARQDIGAIEDVYRNTEFLPDEEKEVVRSLLYEYHSMRTEAIRSRDLDQLALAIERSDEIHDELWVIAVTLRKKTEGSLLNPFVTSVKVLSDAHTVRVHKAFTTRLPPVAWMTLGALLLIAHFMVGFTSGLHGRRSRLAFVVLSISFSAVVIMIVDLDRPIRSLFRQAEDPLARALLEKMTDDRTFKD
jgi:hypothetical protein